MSQSREILISGGLVVGGPQTHVKILCKCLVSKGDKVTIAAAATNLNAKELASFRNIGVRVIVPRFGFGRMKWLGTLQSILTWPFLLKWSYDTLYCLGNGKMHLFAGLFSRKGSQRIYHEIVECPKHNSDAAKTALKMTQLVGNSRLIAHQMRDMFPKIPVSTIPFLTSEAPMPYPSTPKVRGGDTIRLAFLGRVVKHKRPDRLVEEWINLLKLPDFSPARLDIYGGDAGDGMLSRLRESIQAFGLSDQITVHGPYETSLLPAIFEHTDLLILPSEKEGLPLVLVEAMQRGIPIVSTAAGGCEELGDDNPDAEITEGTGWDEFISGLCSMMKRIRQGEIDSNRLYSWTEKRYGFENVSKAWINILSKC